MAPPATPPRGLRERKKARTRHSLQEQAMELFLRQGYECTTVEQIAAAAGVSHMTFFRHFPTKEAVVETDDYDPLIVRLIEERPSDEDPLITLHHALGQGLSAVYERDREALLVRTRLVLRTPALRARVWQNQCATERMFAEALAARGEGEATLDIRVLAAASLAALTTALTVWVDGDGNQDLPALVDRAFRALHGQASS